MERCHVIVKPSITLLYVAEFESPFPSTNVYGCKAKINLESNYKAAIELSTGALWRCWTRLRAHYSQRNSGFNLCIVRSGREANYQNGKW